MRRCEKPSRLPPTTVDGTDLRRFDVGLDRRHEQGHGHLLASFSRRAAGNGIRSSAQTEGLEARRAQATGVGSVLVPDHWRSWGAVGAA